MIEQDQRDRDGPKTLEIPPIPQALACDPGDPPSPRAVTPAAAAPLTAQAPLATHVIRVSIPLSVCEHNRRMSAELSRAPAQTVKGAGCTKTGTGRANCALVTLSPPQGLGRQRPWPAVPRRAPA